ncbi:alpha/beta hydrolase [uncultured Tateyamaria sp.]|uniref:alpha/beta hydrolase n=1 Tax=uncultured Tateyamaria sp. TaxID=455651 RepID=UPI0026313733|nr:alpha/beta hydrolase [uncultured Tateyamaria sp.]
MEPAPFFQEISGGPNNGSAVWTTTRDSIRLRVGYWPAEQDVCGTVFLFPGRTEYIELQGRLARDLVARGFSVLTIDWRGHGLSRRLLDNPATLHVEAFSDYQNDVDAFLQIATTFGVPKPWFLMANSMGGNIGLRAILQGFPVAACSFTAPMWGIEMSQLQRLIASPVAWAACALGRGEVYVPGHDGKNYVSHAPFEGNRITFDPENFGYWVQQARTRPELQTAGSSMKWLHESLRECRRISKLKSPDLPCIAFYGDCDEVVDKRAIQQRMAVWSNSEYVELKHAKHALLLERPEVRAAVISKTVERFLET